MYLLSQNCRHTASSTTPCRCTRQLTRASSSATTSAPECHQTSAARSTALAFHSKLSTPPTSPPAPPSLLSSIIVLHGVPVINAGTSATGSTSIHIYILAFGLHTSPYRVDHRRRHHRYTYSSSSESSSASSSSFLHHACAAPHAFNTGRS